MSQDWKKLIVSIIIVFVIQTIDGNIVNYFCRLNNKIFVANFLDRNKV